MSQVINRSRFSTTVQMTTESQSRTDAKAKIVFCGKEIDIDDENEECERLSPEIVKLRWRREQIEAMRMDSPRKVQNEPSPKALWQQLRYSCSVFESEPSNQCRKSDDTAQVNSVVDELPDDCAHAFWSGWLRLKDAGASAVFRPWQAWWCVLNVERAQLRLDCLEVDASSGSMRTGKSIILDPSCKAKMETSMLTCTGCSWLSIKERGCGRRRRLSCESPEEAERLLTCVNSLLGSLGGGEGTKKPNEW